MLRFRTPDFAIPLGIAGFQLALLIAFQERYGYFRDELYYIACSDHLAWGFVDQPPLSIALLKATRAILGDSLHAIRLLPAVAGACVILLSARIARELGGDQYAQGLAAFSAFAAHGLIGQGRYFSMNAIDLLLWTTILYIFVMVLSRQKPELWLLFGVAVGLGLLNKYSVGFLVIGLVAGLMVTSARRQLATKWFWLSAAIAAILFAPHVVWQVEHGFPSLEFMRNASGEKNVPLGAVDFFLGQVRDMNVASAPLWLAALYFLFRHSEGRFRALSMAYPVIFAIMVAGNAKVYYLSAIYPLLLAAGSVAFARLTPSRGRSLLRVGYPVLQGLIALAALPFAVPVLPVERFIAYQEYLGMKPRAEERSAVAELPQYYADQFGWEEFVDSVAVAYRRLSPEEQRRCVIYTRNYGEAAAVDFFGWRHGLPKALCAHNSYWYWGPGKKTGDVAIIIGGRRELVENLEDLRGVYEEVEPAATTSARYAMPFEVGRMIFVCRGMKTTFQEIWNEERFFI